MTTTASTKQIAYIRRLLATRQHVDNGRTITVGEARFRTTADQLDTISSAVASRLITALKDAPADDRPITHPHFSNQGGRWVIANPDPEWKAGDTVTIRRADGTDATVILTASALDRFCRRIFAFTTAEQQAREAAAQRAADEEAAERAAEEAEEERLAADFVERVEASPASGAQVDYIMRLIRAGRRDEGGFFCGPRDLAGVRRLSRREASLYIDSLTGAY